MALTQQVKAELATVGELKPEARAAEVAAMAFAGGIHVVSGHIVIEAELDSGNAARRLRTALAELYGFDSEVVVVNASGLRRRTRYVVRLVRHGEALARRTADRPAPASRAGTARPGGRWIHAGPGRRLARGFPGPGLIDGAGPFHGPEVTCPSSEAALALVGCARRLGISAKAREVRQMDRVVVRDGDAISALLTRMGAHESVLAWEERRMRREVRASANRLANFDDANLRRSARAAVASSARVERALEILGDARLDHLRAAGELRLAHRQASLEELGHLNDPPLTKDAVAGRIRRLLALADKTATDRGVPTTEAAPDAGDAH